MCFDLPSSGTTFRSFFCPARTTSEIASSDARVRIQEKAIDASSLLALADLTIGAGGTMNRESAILGTPTYTVFVGRLAAVDAELIRLGRLHDLRSPGSAPRFEKKGARAEMQAPNADAILAAIVLALECIGDPGNGASADRPSV